MESTICQGCGHDYAPFNYCNNCDYIPPQARNEHAESLEAWKVEALRSRSLLEVGTSAETLRLLREYRRHMAKGPDDTMRYIDSLMAADELIQHLVTAGLIDYTVTAL